MGCTTCGKKYPFSKKTNPAYIAPRAPVVDMNGQRRRTPGVIPGPLTILPAPEVPPVIPIPEN